MATHKDLDVWKESIDLVVDVYRITKSFPKEEVYGLSAQIRKSAISIPSNIAEGAARRSDKENMQFLYIALGSLSELETQLIIAQRLEYGDTGDVLHTLENLRKKVLNLMKYLKKLMGS
jgi:four helix bundle protein